MPLPFKGGVGVGASEASQQPIEKAERRWRGDPPPSPPLKGRGYFLVHRIVAL